MAPHTLNMRTLLWVLLVSLMIVVVVKLWPWRAPSPMPIFPPVAEPTALVPSSDQAEDAPPVDALWQRYQQLNKMDIDTAAPATEALVPVPSAMPDSSMAVINERQPQAEPAKGQRLDAMKAAQAELTKTIRQAEPGDINAIILAMEQFDRRLIEAGIDNPIDMNAIKQLLRSTNKLHQLNMALLAEAERGVNADHERLRRLSQEIQQLLPKLQPLMTPKLLNEVAHDAHP